MTISFSLNGTSPIWMRQKVRSRIQDPVIACVTDQSKITCTKVAYITLKYIQKILGKKESIKFIALCVFNEVGMSNWVHFWHDCWCGNQPLKRGFPAFVWELYRSGSFHGFLDGQVGRGGEEVKLGCVFLSGF